MDSGQVVSVSTGRAVPAEWAGAIGRTAIDKRPVAGAVRVGRLGLDGDEQADLADHGGPEQALYVYAREDLDWWTRELGRHIRDGAFGENIVTRGLDITGALIGERWQLGSAVVQITSCRIPCGTFRQWTGEKGWVPRFARAGRPGAYLRVLEEARTAMNGCSHVIHLAAIVGGIANFHKLPFTLTEVNNALTGAIVHAAVEQDVQRFTYVSSSMVFERATGTAVRRPGRPTASPSWPARSTPAPPTTSTACATRSADRSTPMARASAPSPTSRASPTPCPT